MKKVVFLTLILALAVVFAVSGCKHVPEKPTTKSFTLTEGTKDDSAVDNLPHTKRELDKERCFYSINGRFAGSEDDLTKVYGKAASEDKDGKVYVVYHYNSVGVPLWAGCKQKAPAPKKMAPVDTDGDGILDISDKCPLEPGPRSNQGCPLQDRDNDGIVDRDDDCPDTPGVKELNGCPRITSAERERFSGTIEGIKFDSGSARIRESSYGVLNEAVELMKNYPNIKLEIKGYTDDRGKDDYNKKLSEDRANSVKNYLIGKGIESNRLKATGYGETNFVAPNNTKAGRAKNRRIEFGIVEN